MFGHVHSLCGQFLRDIGADPLFLLWDALASGAEGKTSAGLSSLQRVTNRVAMGLPVCVAQLAIHKSAQTQDFASIGQCERDLEELSRTASSQAVVQAAQILWLTGADFDAGNLLQPIASQNKSAAAVLGWLKLTAGDASAVRWFDVAGADDPLAIYGRAMFYANIGRWQDALQSLVQLSSCCVFPELAIERAKIYIAMSNWDLALEAAAEATGHCVSNIDVHLLTVVHCLVHSGDLDGARSAFAQFCDCVTKIEAHNPVYAARILPCISGLSWHDGEIVAGCLKVVAVTAQEFKESVDVCVCYGYLLLPAGKPAEARDVFQATLLIASDCVRALTGLVEALLAMQQFAEAHDQLEFLDAMVDRQNPPLHVLALRSKYRHAQKMPVDAQELLKGMAKHLARLRRRPSDTEGPQKLRVDRVLDNLIALDMDCFSLAVTEIMSECNTLDHTVAEPFNDPVCDALIFTLDIIPGCIPFQYYLAVLAYGEERYEEATHAIHFVLTSHWGFNPSQCHLLLAQIRLEMKQFDDAEAALQRAVSYDFGVRATLRYQMINARLSEARAQFDKAIEIVLEIKKGAEFPTSSSNEKINLALFLAQCYQKAGKDDMAIKTVQDCKAEWKGTAEEDRIEIFRGTLIANLGKVRDGLDILEAFEPTSLYFSRARKSAAKIYITKLNDKANYLHCFKLLVEKDPGKESYMMLGNAYMKVNQFEEAVRSFSRALDADPSDQKVALNLARSLMVVHQYEAAIGAYVQAVNMSCGDIHAQLEYARALAKIRRYDEALGLSQEMLQLIAGEGNDWDNQSVTADFYELISVIELQSGNDERSSEALQKALSLYDELTAASRTDIPADSLIELKAKASTLYRKAADGMWARDDLDAALLAYEKALQLSPGESSVVLALARVYSLKENTDKCREYCQQILRVDANCEEAALIFAEVSASATVEELAETFMKSPTSYGTLMRLVQKCAWVGELELVPKFFDQAKEGPGFLFCQGLYNVYIGNPQKALSFLNKSRLDASWKTPSLELIFDIYSNPNRKYVWCETKPLATPKDLDSAKKILAKLAPGTLHLTRLEAQLLLSQNTTDSVTEALRIYSEGDENDMHMIIGKCKCFLRLNRQRDATRHLNGIVHGQPKHSHVSAFVEAYLMMAFIGLRDQQIDEAVKYTEKALALDKSCGKAWELTAIISERKKEYLNAAEAFRHTWDLSGHTDLGVGFKLAVNFMRGGDPVEAIKVARAILAIHPNYPKLKETVLLPCCAALRS
jgi:tetratricopeptide repeat protein 21B